MCFILIIINLENVKLQIGFGKENVFCVWMILDWGDGTITIYCGNHHTHCGYPDAAEDELIKLEGLT